MNAEVGADITTAEVETLAGPLRMKNPRKHLLVLLSFDSIV